MLTDLLAAHSRGDPIDIERLDLAALTDEFARLPAPKQTAFARLIDAAFRAEARRSVAVYVDYLELGFRPAKHHRLLLSALEEVASGKCERLMVLMPPGSGKSIYTTQVFPSWYLGHHPTRSVIAASHTQELIERFGRRTRNYYASPQHLCVFGNGVAGDSKAAARWDTTEGGEYYATGIGGAVAGRRADLGIIDDPVKSREDADSERSRERAWDWYLNDFLTRLKPGAAAIFSTRSKAIPIPPFSPLRFARPIISMRRR